MKHPVSKEDMSGPLARPLRNDTAETSDACTAATAKATWHPRVIADVSGGIKSCVGERKMLELDLK